MVKTDTCSFCSKELTYITITGRNFPIGEKCWNKVMKGNVNWDEDSTLTSIKNQMRKAV